MESSEIDPIDPLDSVPRGTFSQDPLMRKLEVTHGVKQAALKLTHELLQDPDEYHIQLVENVFLSGMKYALDLIDTRVAEALKSLPRA